jgi:hypothetical protein
MGDVVDLYNPEANEAKGEMFATMRRILAAQEKLLKTLETLRQTLTPSAASPAPAKDTER